MCHNTCGNQRKTSGLLLALHLASQTTFLTVHPCAHQATWLLSFPASVLASLLMAGVLELQTGATTSGATSGFPWVLGS